MFVFQDSPKLYACLGGLIRPDPDRERMDRYWNPVVAAWYPEGKDDPRLTLLRLDARDAEVWITEAGPARFAWEIAKANATREQPDLGGRTTLNLH
jgi:general stress protein 26